MATLNPFDLLGDDDTEDPLQLIAVQQQKVSAQAQKGPASAVSKQQPSKPPANLPSKPLPPAQAVKEAKAEGGRGGGRGRGYGRGRGGAGFNRESTNTENMSRNREFSGGLGVQGETDGGRPGERRGGYDGERRGGYDGERRGGYDGERRSGYDGPRGSFRGGRRGGFSNGEVGDGEHGEQRRRPFERRSGTGRGNEIKREGAGRGNWGTHTDELSQVDEEVVNEGEKIFNTEKPPSLEEGATEGNKDTPANETEEKEPENKEMTLEEYEKLLEEKRKALLALKTEERKVDDKAFATMQQLANKKSNDDIFIKLGSEKDKKKEFAEKEERAKKVVSINEFLKPAEGDKYYGSGGRGRGRGRGRGFGGGNPSSNVEAPSIEDPGQFPTLSAK